MKTLSFCLFSLVHACAPIVQNSGSQNATLQYWQAFVQMPASRSLSERERGILKGWRESALDDEAKSLLARYQRALAHLRRGAQFTLCDWGIAANIREDGIGLDVEYLIRARDLGFAALLQARGAFVARNCEDAVEDVLATISFSRHLSRDSTINGLSLGCQLESDAIYLLSQNLAGLDEKLLNAVQARLKGMPESGSLMAALTSENEMIQASYCVPGGMTAFSRVLYDIEGLKTAQDNERKRVIGTFLGLDDKNISVVRKQLDKQFSVLGTLVDLPPDQFAQREAAIRKELSTKFHEAGAERLLWLSSRNDKEAKDVVAFLEREDLRIVQTIKELVKTASIKASQKADPPVVYLLPSVTIAPIAGARYAQAKTLVDRTLLLAALSVLTKGDEQILRFRDPILNRPIELQRAADNIVLVSECKDREGRPIVLKVSKSRAK